MSARVYGLYDSRDEHQKIRYVGSTKKPLRARFVRHVAQARRGETYMPVLSWILANHEYVKIKELEVCDDADRWKREEAWIRELKTLTSQGGYNAVQGKSHAGRKLTQDHKDKIRAAAIKQFSDPAQRQRVSQALTGRTISDSQRLAMSRAARRSNHVRHHVNRGLVKPGCDFCVQDPLSGIH